MTRIALLLLLALALPLSACTDDPSVDNPDAGDDADTDDARDGDEEVIDPDGGDDTDTDVEPAPWNPDPLAGRAEDFTTRTGNYQGPFYNCEREDGLTQRFRCGHPNNGAFTGAPLVDCAESMPEHIMSGDYNDYSIKGIDCAELGMVCVQGLLPDSDGCAVVEETEPIGLHDLVGRSTITVGEASREVFNYADAQIVVCEPGYVPFWTEGNTQAGCIERGCSPAAAQIDDGADEWGAVFGFLGQDTARTRYLHYSCD